MGPGEILVVCGALGGAHMATARMVGVQCRCTRVIGTAEISPGGCAIWTRWQLCANLVLVQMWLRHGVQKWRMCRGGVETGGEHPVLVWEVLAPRGQ